MLMTSSMASSDCPNGTNSASFSSSFPDSTSASAPSPGVMLSESGGGESAVGRMLLPPKAKPTETFCALESLLLHPPLHEPGREVLLAIAAEFCDFNRLDPDAVNGLSVGIGGEGEEDSDRAGSSAFGLVVFDSSSASAASAAIFVI